MNYRQRAARALGRPLLRTEHVHHHSTVQLVICTREYHMWLHAEMRRCGINARIQPPQYIMKGLDDALWHAVKVKAAREQVTVKDVIVRALASWVSMEIDLCQCPVMTRGAVAFSKTCPIHGKLATR